MRGGNNRNFNIISNSVATKDFSKMVRGDHENLHHPSILKDKSVVLFS